MRLNSNDQGLIEAVLNNNLHQAYQFLMDGADVNVRRPSPPFENQHTPLHLAAHRGNIAMLSLLLEFGADRGKKGKKDEYTPAKLAKKSGLASAANFINSWNSNTNVRAQVRNEILEERRRSQLISEGALQAKHNEVIIKELQTTIINQESAIGMGKKTAIASTLLTTGAGLLFLAIAMVLKDKDNAFILVCLALSCIGTGAAILGYEAGIIAKNAGDRADYFFKRIEANADRVSNTIAEVGDAIQSTSEILTQSIARLSKTSEESVVIVRDEMSETLRKLRGKGKDVAAALIKGIEQKKFKPEAKVNVKVDVNADHLAEVNPVVCCIQ